MEKSKINNKESNSTTLEDLNEIMSQQHGKWHSISDYIEKYTPKMISEVNEFLSGGKLVEFGNSDVGCYDAEVHEDGQTYFVEATLDKYKRVEDFYCTCHNKHCIHLYSVLWRINEYLKAN